MTATDAARVRYAAPLTAFDHVEVTPDGHDTWRLRVEQHGDARDPYLAGHFPTFTIYPGVFLLETVSQAVDHALRADPDDPLRVTAIHSMRFLSPLLDHAALAAELRVVREPDASDAYDVWADCHRREGGPTIAEMHVTMSGHGRPA